MNYLHLPETEKSIWSALWPSYVSKNIFTLILVLLVTISIQVKLAYGQCEVDRTGSGASVLDDLGRSVAISDKWFAVGSPRTDGPSGVDYGSVRVFRREGESWIHHAILTSQDGTDMDQFGSSVAIDGDLMVIGAAYDEDNGVNAGSAYVFRRNDRATPTVFSDDIWEEQQKLVPSDTQAHDYFGISVDISSSTIIVGASQESQYYGGPGKAFVFVSFDGGSTWVEQFRLSALDEAIWQVGCDIRELGHCWSIFKPRYSSWNRFSVYV